MDIKTLKRQELKYYINFIDYFNISSIISKIFSKDPHNTSNGAYHIRSLYFDNKSNQDYHQKINGIEKRKKIRIRLYNLNSSLVKLEIKNKFNDYIVKKSLIISTDDTGELISGNYNCLLDYRDAVAVNVYKEFLKDFYRPVILIDYKREAYNYDLNQIRINFDSQIKKREINLGDLFINDNNASPVLSSNKIIMEIKFNGRIPTWIKNLLQLPRFERCAISKYTLSRYMEG